MRNDPFSGNPNFRTDTALEKSEKLWSFKKYLFTFAKDKEQEVMMIRSAWWWRYSRIQNS
jgi:hypothetical protein